MAHVLIVDDDSAFTSATTALLESEGFVVTAADSVGSAQRALAESSPAIVLLDIVLPDGSGLDLIEALDPVDGPRIAVMTAHPTLDIAIDSLRARVADFLIKPVEPSQLLQSLKAMKRALDRADSISPSADSSPAFEQLVGNSPVMLNVYRLIDRVAPSHASVLVRGQSGTGKELVAQAVHARSERKGRPFLSLNCGAVSKELIASQLFGHEKGSFTGAVRQHRGYFERADGGTLFLDEITEMPSELQVQLLRVLESGNVMRLGGEQEIPVDVRIIAATNRDCESAIREGYLREDLYFRLAVFPIDMPSLADRGGDDIALIARYFLKGHNIENRTRKCFTQAALDWLRQHDWPGNVRELKNAIHRAYILAEDTVTSEHLSTIAFDTPVSARVMEQTAEGILIPIGVSLEKVERQLIYATLAHYNGDKPKTAEVLGVSLKTLYNRLKQYESESWAKDKKLV